MESGATGADEFAGLSGAERIAAIKAKAAIDTASNSSADTNAAATTASNVKAVANIVETAQEPEPDWKVFIDDMGLMYRGLTPKSPSHASKPLATRDMIEVLDETPCSQEHMVGRIIALGHKRAAAILEPIPNNPVDGA